jgi:hypothetical protein
MELYAKGDIQLAISSGKKAIDYATAKTFDVHFRDSALTCIREANVIVSPHDDDTNPPMFACPRDDDACCAAAQSAIEELEASLPKKSKKGAKGDPNPKDLTPAQLLLIWQIGQYVWSLFQRRK